MRTTLKRLRERLRAAINSVAGKKGTSARGGLQEPQLMRIPAAPTRKR